MRTLTAAFLTVLLALPAAAQEGDAPPPAPPGPDPKRVAVAATASLDGQAAKPNTLQYFLWERLNAFKLRVDCANPIGAKQFDNYVAKITRWWEKEEPEAGPASLTVTANQTTRYDASVFYGQAQAHNFKGELHAEIRDPAGEVLATFEFPFTYGRSIGGSRLTKNQVFQTYNQISQTGLALLLLNHPSLHDRVPEKKREALKAWSIKERDRLLEMFDNSTDAMRESELANLLRDLQLED